MKFYAEHDDRCQKCKEEFKEIFTEDFDTTRMVHCDFCKNAKMIQEMETSIHGYQDEKIIHFDICIECYSEMLETFVKMKGLK